MRRGQDCQAGQEFKVVGKGVKGSGWMGEGSEVTEGSGIGTGILVAAVMWWCKVCGRRERVGVSGGGASPLLTTGAWLGLRAERVVRAPWVGGWWGGYMG